MKGKKVLLGVTGSISAYKSAALVSTLSQLGVEVRVVMTEKATDLVGAQTFRALSGQPVLLDSEERLANHAMDHIESARWADVMLVSPCSANTLGSLAHGFGDNLLSTLYLAFEGPIGLVPAMNPVMWSKPSVQRNLEQCKADGCKVLMPEEGLMACGETGVGRLPAEDAILKFLEELSA